MKSEKEQLDELLKLGLTVHPLNQNNCWGVFASTPQKAIKRYIKIKEIFPLTSLTEVTCLEGDFGVNLYGELKK